MKKTIIIMCAIAATALGFTYKSDLKTMGLRFVAPAVTDKNTVLNPEEGEIVYEATPTERKFYGRSNSGWVPLSAGESIIPAGVILPFGGTTAPTGFLFARGQALLIADYPDLATTIGTAYGDGSKNADGTLTGYAAGTAFNLPDLRGRFMRGVDAGAGRDFVNERSASNAGGNTLGNIGSVQDDAFKSHAHTVAIGDSGSYGGPNIQGRQGAGGLHTSSGAGGSETRPKNLYVNYIIKY